MLFIKKRGIGYVLFALICTLMACAAKDELTLAEQAVADKYYHSYGGAIFGLQPDEWADGKVYQQHYRHGIYDATFQSLAAQTDFMQMPADSLQRMADAIHADLLQAIPQIELYDSIRVRFMTRYKSHQTGEWPSADTSIHVAERRFAYGLR